MSDEIVAVTTVDDVGVAPALGVVLELDESDLVEGNQMNNAGNRRVSNRLGAGWIAPLLGGVGIGAALMYLFDPDRVRGRRARLSDQVVSNANRLGETVERKARDLRNRTQGLLHEVGLLGAKQAGNRSNRSELRTESTSAGLGVQVI